MYAWLVEANGTGESGRREEKGLGREAKEYSVVTGLDSERVYF